MKKEILLELAVIVLVMAVLPCLILLVPGQWGLMLYPLTLLYFYPIFSLGLGIYAGRALRRRWFLPPISSAVFLIAASMVFGGTLVNGTGVYLVYSMYYLILGALAMALRWLLKNK